MRQELCLCAGLPLVAPRTRVVVVTGRREAQVPTGTGRLATQALAGSVLLVRGDLDRNYDLGGHLLAGRPSLVLFPDERAPPLTPALAAELGGPINLIVPDGSWRQAAKMRRRDPVMAALPAVALPPMGPSGYAVRREIKAGGLATLEAIARALALLEGEELRAPLDALMATMVARTLASRGIRGTASV